MNLNDPRLEKLYVRKFKNVRKVLFEEDIFGDFEAGAPDDEYDSEISEILIIVDKCKNVDDLTDEIFRIFRESYGENSAGKRTRYVNLAKKILKVVSVD